LTEDGTELRQAMRRCSGWNADLRDAIDKDSQCRRATAKCHFYSKLCRVKAIRQEEGGRRFGRAMVDKKKF